MKNRKILMQFDKYDIPISFETVKSMIEDEIERLSKVTGFPGNKLPLLFEEQPKSERIAYFTYEYSKEDPNYKGKPLSFTFNLSKVEGLSANQLMDTVRHEFGHYVRLMRHGPKGDHDTLWQNIGGELGYNPSPYYYPYRTMLFEV